MCASAGYFTSEVGLINMGYIVNEIGRILSKMS